MHTTRKAWLLLALMFISGIAAGAFGMRAYMMHRLPQLLQNTRESMEDRIVDHISREVGLTDEQKQNVRPLIHEATAKADTIHQAVRTNLEAIFTDMDDRIAAQLTDEQKVKFRGLRERMEKLRRHGPPPPPGEGPNMPPPPGFGPPPPPPPQ